MSARETMGPIIEGVLTPFQFGLLCYQRRPEGTHTYKLSLTMESICSAKRKANISCIKDSVLGNSFDDGSFDKYGHQ